MEWVNYWSIGVIHSIEACYIFVSVNNFLMYNVHSSMLIYHCQVSMDLNSASTVVLQVLTQATSQDTAVLKPAEEQLKQWETQPGFYSVLLVSCSKIVHDIFFNKMRNHYFNCFKNLVLLVYLVKLNQLFGCHCTAIY